MPDGKGFAMETTAWLLLIAVAYLLGIRSGLGLSIRWGTAKMRWTNWRLQVHIRKVKAIQAELRQALSVVEAK